jgi:tRNA(adenine34) deaminase
MVYQDKVIAKGSRASSIGPSSNEIDHAEMITLRRLWESAKKIHPNQITVYCTMEPCLMCFAALILAGIKKIVYAYEDVMGGGTQADLSDLPPLYSASGVLVIPGILRDESLHLFRQFFSNPNNHYWKGSLLEGYTLNHDQHYH